MTQEAQPLISSETISAVAELWRLATVFMVLCICYMFRTPITQFLQNLRKFRRKDTEIELTPPPESTKPMETDAASAEKPVPDLSQQEPQSEAVNGDALFAELLGAIMARDRDSARDLFSRWMEDGPGNSHHNEVVYYALWCRFQNDSHAVEKLETFRHDDSYREEHPRILETLANFYEAVGQYDKALELHEDRAVSSTTARDRITAASEKQRIIAITQTPEEALQGLRELLLQMLDDECFAIVYHQIAETFRRMGDELMRSVALEKLLQYRANDASARFEAAYAQSRAKLPYLALKNYEVELSLNPSSMNGRNNYAVQLENLGFTVKSAEEYARAREWMGILWQRLTWLTGTSNKVCWATRARYSRQRRGWKGTTKTWITRLLICIRWRTRKRNDLRELANGSRFTVSSYRGTRSAAWFLAKKIGALRGLGRVMTGKCW